MTLRSFGTIKPTPKPNDDEEPLEAIVEEDEEDESAEEQETNEKVRSKEAAKYRVRAKNAETKVAQLEARVAELEGSAGNEELIAENLELRIANAFLEEAAGRFTDLGAAYKLLDQALIDVNGEGEVSGMRDAVSTVATRYPFLTQEENKPTKTPARSLRAVRLALQRCQERQGRLGHASLG